MTERIVTDPDGTQWTCIQALGGVNGASADEVADRLESEAGTIPVVCTPNGGAQSVRLELDRSWEEKVDDEGLLQAISETRNHSSHVRG
ncbi:MAG: hypothetical protein EOP84_10960 [Verrucomicrobiaceae bacterium]|nr:MAG: hypothetical protein EOP84_10960 [Verrucomicrobiaceae bacterium]